MHTRIGHKNLTIKTFLLVVSENFCLNNICDLDEKALSLPLDIPLHLLSKPEPLHAHQNAPQKEKRGVALPTGSRAKTPSQNPWLWHCVSLSQRSALLAAEYNALKS